MVEQESAQGLHMLLFTYAPVLVSLLSASDTPTLPYELIPLGLISLSDQLRSQAHETHRQLGQADIRFKVICGDHPQTVAALIEQMGLSSDIRAVSGLALASASSVNLLCKMSKLFTAREVHTS